MNNIDLECTWWPDVWFGVSIQDCCIAHDLGGSDLELFSCVASDKGLPIIAVVMIIGLIVGRPIYRKIQKYKRKTNEPKN